MGCSKTPVLPSTVPGCALLLLCGPGCTLSTCVTTCQSETVTYTVFIGEVCAQTPDDARQFSADVPPCRPEDVLISTECLASKNLCLFPGVLFPPPPLPDPVSR